jgi:hypothetical protein
MRGGEPLATASKSLPKAFLHVSLLSDITSGYIQKTILPVDSKPSTAVPQS